MSSSFSPHFGQTFLEHERKQKNTIENSGEQQKMTEHSIKQQKTIENLQNITSFEKKKENKEKSKILDKKLKKEVKKKTKKNLRTLWVRRKKKLN